MIYFVDGLFWGIALVLGLIAWSRSRHLLRDSVREGIVDCLRLLPRIMLGVVGSGYIAAILPQEVVGHWLGKDSGIIGLFIAVLGGAFTPGGPVIGFSIGAAALKGGAGTPQVIAYTIAWALVCGAAADAVGNPGDAATAGVAARAGVAAAAVPGGGRRDAAGTAVAPAAHGCRSACSWRSPGRPGLADARMPQNNHGETP